MNLSERLTSFIAQGDHFALIARSNNGEGRSIELLKGAFVQIDTLTEMPIECRSVQIQPFGHKVMTLVPFRQITERGFVAVDDGTPLLSMIVDDYEKFDVNDFLASTSQQELRSVDVGFDIDDGAYAERVQRIIERDRKRVRVEFRSQTLPCGPHR